MTGNSLILHPFTHLTTIFHTGAPRAAHVLPRPALVGPEKVQNMLPVLTTRLLDQVAHQRARAPATVRGLARVPR